jgi:hypothetical protein
MIRPTRDYSLLVPVLAVAIVILGPLAFVWPERDPKMNAAATETALRKQLGTPYGFRCRPEENEGSTVELDDVDYVCEADRVSAEGFWVGTDKSKITGTQSTG